MVRRASAWPTSPAACTPTRRSSPRCSIVSARAPAMSIEVSLFDALTEWMSHPIYYTMFCGEPPERTGAAHARSPRTGRSAPLDGSVQLGIQNEREWVRSARPCSATRRLASRRPVRDQRRPCRSSRTSYVEMIERAFASARRSRWWPSLDAARSPTPGSTTWRPDRPSAADRTAEMGGGRLARWSDAGAEAAGDHERCRRALRRDPCARRTHVGHHARDRSRGIGSDG